MTAQNRGGRFFQVLSQDILDLQVRDFILDVQAANRSPRTVEFYKLKLRNFTTFLKREGVQDAAGITAAHIRAFLAELAQGHNPGGVHRHYQAIKTWLKFLVREDVIPSSPVDKVRAPTVPDEPLAPVSLEVFNALLATCDRSEMGLRNRAILMVLLDSGLRASELCALNVGDVDLNDGAVLVRRSKSKRPRTTFIGRQARKAVAAYLRVRGNPGPDEPLWTAVRADGAEVRLAYDGLAAMVRRRAKAAGVKPPTLHSFRRAFAIMSLRNGADPVSLSRMLGHGSLPVILRYLKQERGDLAAVHNVTSPVDRLKR